MNSQSIAGLGWVFKANPYHDKLGRFAEAGNAWTQVGGQLGSNSGGVYNHGGVKKYVKFPASEGQVLAEQAADKIHDLLGIESMKHQAQEVNGRMASVSEWRQVTPLGHSGWSGLNDTQKQQAANAFVAAALTKNWDVVGLEYDNMGKTAEGNLAIMDTGGSFTHRAMGDPKPYGVDPTPEIHGMLDTSRESGAVFAPLMRANREMFVAAARKLSTVSDEQLLDAAQSLSPAVRGTLLERKKAILKFFSV